MVATVDSIKLRKYRRIIWCIVLAFLFISVVLANFGLNGVRITFELMLLMVLYALHLGSRIRRAERGENYHTLQMALARQVGPPLLLLPLFMMPFNELGVFLWMVGVLAALLSIPLLLIRMVRRGVGFSMGNDDPPAADDSDCVRCVRCRAGGAG